MRTRLENSWQTKTQGARLKTTRLRRALAFAGSCDDRKPQQPARQVMRPCRLRTLKFRNHRRRGQARRERTPASQPCRTSQKFQWRETKVRLCARADVETNKQFRSRRVRPAKPAQLFVRMAAAASSASQRLRR